jgi:phage I-like protein
MTTLAYWSDLLAIKLAEPNEVTWLHALPIGNYRHPVHKIIKIDMDRVKRFADNVNAKVRGIDLDVDFDHKKYHGEAAGWIIGADARDSGLWVGVKFTEDARSKIKSGKYRYFSSEFLDQWEHPGTGEKFQDVLNGGALTNRPYLKDVLPINLSELDSQEGEKVDEFLKQLRDKLGLPEEATEEQILEAAHAPAPPGNGNGEEEGKEEEEQEQEETVAVSEDLKKLAEENPAIGQLVTMVNGLGSQVKQLSDSNESLQKEAKTAKAELATERLSKDGKFAIAPAKQAEVTKMLAEGASGDEIATFLSDIVKGNGLVELGERGTGGGGTERTASAVEEYEKRVKKLMTEDEKLEYADAALHVMSEDPDFYEQYRREVSITTPAQ